MANEFKIKKGLIVNETDLYVSESKAGVGTTSPDANLHVSGSTSDNRLLQVGSNYLVITGSNGYVGIGTSSPGATLDIEGELHLYDNGSTSQVHSQNNPLYLTSATDLRIHAQNTGGDIYLDANGFIKLREAGADVLTIDGGNVGIGTTSPSAKLHVSGTLADNREFQVGDNYLVVTGSNGNVGIGTTSPSAKLHVDGNITGSNATFSGNVTAASFTGSLLATNGIISSSGNLVSGELVYSTGGSSVSSSNLLYLDTVNKRVGVKTTSPQYPFHYVEDTGFALAVYEKQGGAAIFYEAQEAKGALGTVASHPLAFAINSAEVSRINTSGVYEGDLSGSLTGTASYASNADLLDGINSSQFLRNDQNGTLTGDLTVTGTITAEEFHTEFVSASIIYQSGSTKFGDTSDDVHSFSGSLRVTGSGDHYFTDGNVGIGTTSPSANLHVNPDTINEIAIAINGTQNYSANNFQRISAGDASSLNRLAIGFGYNSTPEWTIRYSSYHNHEFYTGNDWGSSTERMRIDSSGTIIGTGTYTTSNSIKIFEAQRLGGAVASDWSYDDATTDMSLGTSTAHSFSFKTGGTRALTIDSSQNVGIGTTSPSAKLHISGTIADNREFQVGSNYLVVTGSNGYVGIGTTSPQSSLHVDSNGTGTTSNGITLRNSTNQLHYWYLEDNTTSVFDIGSVSGLYKFKAPVFFSSSIEVNDGNQLYFSGQSGDYASISFTDDDPDGWLFSYKQNSGQTAFLKFSSTSEAAGDGTITMGTTGNNLHINNGGNVGIGTTSPGSALDVAGILTINTRDIASNPRLVFNHDNILGASFIEVDRGTEDMEFWVSGSERMRIMDNGNVGIGTTSPSKTLHVLTTAEAALFQGSATWGTAVQIDATGTGGRNYQIQSTADSAGEGGGKFIIVDKDASSATRLAINSSGNVGIGTTSPSASLNVGAAGTLHFTESGIGSMLLKGTSGTARGMFEVHNADGASKALLQAYSGGASVGTLSETNLDIITSGSARMTISGSNGNVGIGTTNPTFQLHVVGNSYIDADSNSANLTLGRYTGQPSIKAGSDDGGYLIMDSTGGRAALNWYTSDHVVLAIGGGNVGIGTSSPPQKLTVAGTISGSSDLSIDGNSVFDGTVGYNTFNSGFGGNGWRIDSNANAEFANLTVRGTFSVYELLAQQIRATNGSLLVATSGKVESTGSLTLFFDTGSQYGHGFLPGDILLAQRLDPAGGQLKRTFLTVETVSSTGSLTYKDLSGNSPEAGQEFVRIGSTSSLDRQGHIYLTADDSNAPYIGVRDGVSGSTQFTSGTGSIEKVRMGKLSGITSNTFGTLSGYGLWASGSVYLEGGISATFGDIGGFNITDSAITSSGNLLSLKSNGQITASNALIGGTSKIAGFTVSDTQINSGTNLVLKSSGQITGSNVLFTGGKISGSSLAIDVTTLTAKGNDVQISGSNFHLLNGNITASNVDLSGNITATTGNIGGFAITSDAITGSGFYLSGSATGTGFFISASNFNVKANGQLTASAAFIGGTSKIAGFTVSDTQINSGTNLLLKSNGQITGSNVLFTGGKISGSAIEFDVEKFTAKGNTVQISGSNFHLLNGNITASNVDLSGNITATTGNIGGFAITSNAITGSGFYLSGSATGTGFFISASNFNVKANGQLTASAAQITGTISAGDGDIGGWTIAPTFISSSDVTLFSTGTIVAGTSINRVAISAAHPYYRLWAGATDAGSPGSPGAPFRVRNTGELEATNAIISGSIKATSGTIGGFTISGDALAGSNFYLSGSATGTGFFISASNFNVKANGQLTASAAQITGEINATAGNIGGFSLSQHAIAGSGFYLSGSATGNQFFISASNFNVKANGDVTGSSVLLDGGEIGGFAISATSLTSDNTGQGDASFVDRNMSLSSGKLQLQGDFQGSTTGTVLVQMLGTGRSNTAGDDYKTSILSAYNLDTSTPLRLLHYPDGITLGGTVNGFIFDVEANAIVIPESENPLDNDVIFSSASLAFNKSTQKWTFDHGIDVVGSVSASSLTLYNLSNQGSEGTALMINGSNVVGTRELGSNAFNSDTIGTTTNALTVSTGLDLNSGTTFNGSAARTITLDLTEVTANSATSNAVLTNDGDGTLTAETNLTYGGTDLTNAGGGYIVDRAATNFTVFKGLDSNDNGIQMGIDGSGDFYMAPVNTGTTDFADELRVVSGLGWRVDQSLGVGVAPNATNGRIDASNDVVAFSTSDKRLKENITEISNPLFKIEKISGVEFDWKPLTDEERRTIHGFEGHDVGVIAQEIEEVLPEVVTERENGYKAVKYEKIVPLLIEGIKELKQENNTLRQELDEIKKILKL